MATHQINKNWLTPETINEIVSEQQKLELSEEAIALVVKCRVYLDENNLRMTMNLRNNFTRLANALLEEGKREKAVEVLDRCLVEMPLDLIPVNYFMIGLVEAYYKAGEFEKAQPVVDKMLETSEQDLQYYLSLDKNLKKAVDREIQMALYMLQNVYQQAKSNGQNELADSTYQLLDKYHKQYSLTK